MRPRTIWTTAAFLLLAGSIAQADVLELKSGTILNGKFEGGTASTVRFSVAGEIQVLPTSEILALTFTGAAPAEAPPSTPPPATAPATTPPAATPPPAPPPAKPAPVTLPTGTSLVVRMKDGISSKNAAGTPFTTKLEYDLYRDGVRVLPAGSLIYGVVKSSSEARRLRGQSTLDIRLTQVIVGRQPVNLVSTEYAEAGERAIKDAARGAAAGAAIGAIADGGDGAGTGAAIGGLVGALKRGESITIAPGTLLEFKLASPLTVTVGG